MPHCRHVEVALDPKCGECGVRLPVTQKGPQAAVARYENVKVRGRAPTGPLLAAIRLYVKQRGLIVA